ncbi:hypothetical protein [Pseudonocardia ammonioxydans]|uniref:hypothetical protein n=1 Tax=Pseudonocardia ammonioxydans TaxID=260086 RepID=UPI001FE6424D|nr:hypothetical protein [Pseudonocardia ammonioxydans]
MIEERAHLLARIQQEAIAAATAAGVTGSAVDELLAERRAEAARDADDHTGAAAPTEGCDAR